MFLRRKHLKLQNMQTGARVLTSDECAKLIFEQEEKKQKEKDEKEAQKAEWEQKKKEREEAAKQKAERIAKKKEIAVRSKEEATKKRGGCKEKSWKVWQLGIWLGTIKEPVLLMQVLLRGVNM